MADADRLEPHASFDFRMRRGLKILQAECRQLLGGRP
jgi:hypothetical protein